uniref:Cyclin-dependent kinase 5 activator n=1 Tax=Caenorhabditis japonica TaxID=281687 RepID=A0A8R1HQ54_CAEJA
MTSPLPHRPQTSVCNHLFSPGDGGPTFAPQQQESPRPSAKESVLVQGWNWSKRNIQPVMSRRSLLKSSNMSEATSSKSSNSLVSFTCNASTFTTKQSEKTTVSLDKNQNYKVNAVNDENKELDVLRFVNLDSSTSTSFYSTWYKRIPRSVDQTTIIPNYYSLREEFRRGVEINHGHDAVNNNLNENGNEYSISSSPKHVAKCTIPRLINPDDNGNEDLINYEGDAMLPESANGKRRTIIQASTSELLRGLGIFIANHCTVKDFNPVHLVTWLRSVDRSLLLQGWQDIAFINPANLVFIYMLVRDELPGERHLINTLEELHAWTLSCLYVSYSYMGNEISYPLKPFVIGNDRAKFWNRCMSMVTTHSRKMLLLNSSSSYFSEVFSDLKHCLTE